MINFNNTYASTFSVEDKGTYVKARLSTSRKDQNGNYVNSYWNAMFFGKCKEEAKSLTDKSRIHITSAGVSNEPYTDAEGEKKSYCSVKIFDFELLGSNTSSDETAKKKSSSKTTKKPTKKSAKKPETDDFDIDDDGVPF